MASKDIDLEDFDLDDELDLDFGDFDLDSGKPPSKRKPLDRVGTGMAQGAKDAAMSKTFRRNLIKDSLPTGYVKVYDDLGEAKQVGEDLYNTASDAIRPVKKHIKKLGRSALDKGEKFLPKSVAETLRSWTEEDSSATDRLAQADLKETQITAALGDIFGTQLEENARLRAEESAESVAKEAAESTRHETNVSILDDIRSSMMRLTTYQDRVTSSYQRKSLELQFRQYFLAQDQFQLWSNYAEKSSKQFDAIMYNTSLPDFVKLRISEQASEIMHAKFINRATSSIRDYSSNFVNNVKKRLVRRTKELAGRTAEGIREAADTMEMTQDVPIDGMEVAGSAVGGGLTEALGRKVGGILGRSVKRDGRIARIGQNLEYYSDNRGEVLRDFLKNERNREARDGFMGAVDRSRSGLADLLYESIPKYSAETTYESNSAELAAEAAAYNTLADKSITEIIPGLLSRILNETEMIRTGQTTERLTYNFERNQFTRQSQVDEDVMERILPKQQAENIRQRMDDVIDQVDADKQLSRGARDALMRQLIKDASEAKGFDPTRLATARGLSEVSNDEHREEITTLFSSRFTGEDGAFRQGDIEASRLRTKAARGFRNARDEIPNYQQTISSLMPVYGREQLERMGLLTEGSSQFDARINLEEVRRLLEQGSAIRNDANPYSQERDDVREASNAFGSDSVRSSMETGGSGYNDVGLWDDPRIIGVLERLASIPTQEATDARFNQVIDSIAAINPTVRLDRSNQWLKDIYELLLDWRTTPPDGGPGGPGGNPFGGPNPDSGLGSMWNRTRLRGAANADNVTSLIRAKASRASKRFGTIMNRLRGGRQVVGGDTIQNYRDQIMSFGDVMRGVDWPAGNDSNAFFTEQMDTARDLGSRFASRFKRKKDAVKDLYVADTKTPAIKATKLLMGHYRDQMSGEVLRSLKDIKGPVIDIHGNVVLSLEDIARGIVDVSGKTPKIGLASTVGRAAGGILNLYGGMFGAVGKTIKGSVRLVSGLAGRVGGSLRNKPASPVGDIYLRGRSMPVLLKRDLLAGLYRNQLTGEVIRSIDDITGPVVDADGNIVISATDIEQGLVVNKEGTSLLTKLGGLAGRVAGFAGSIAGGYAGIVGTAFGLAKGLFNKGLGWLKSVRDVYVPGEANPRLLAVVMRNGGYFSQATGKVIRSLDEIDGTVIDRAGNVVISLEEMRQGLFDVSGNRIKGIASRLGNLVGKGIGAVKGLYGGMFSIGRSVMDRGLGLLFGNKTESSEGSGLFSRFTSGATKQVDLLTEIRDILDQRLEKPVSGDLSGDGLRDGGWRERLKQAKAANDESTDDANKSSDDKQSSLLKKLTGSSLFAKIFGGGDDETGNGGMDVDLGLDLGGDGSDKPSRKPPKGGKGGFIRRSLSKVGGLVSSAARFAVPAALAVGKGAVGLVGGALSGLGALISAPVLLGAAAVAGVGAAGYLAYKHLYKAPEGPLHRVRLAQYGIDPDNKDHFGRVGALEKRLLDEVQYSTDGPASIGSGIELPELLEIFGLSTENEELVSRWAHWFQNRFKPVFLTHATVAHQLAPGVNLMDLDDELSPSLKLTYLNRVKFSQDGQTPYGVSTSPFDDIERLEISSADVQREIDAATEEFRSDGGKETSVKSMPTLAAVKPAAADTTPTRLPSRSPQSIRKPTPTTRARPQSATASVAGKAITYGALAAVTIKPYRGRVHALLAIRMKTYGLTQMEADKIGTLLALEETVLSDVSFSGNAASFKRSADVYFERFAAAFGRDMSNANDREEWSVWFTRRFVPTLLTYATELRKVGGQQGLEGASKTLKGSDAVSVAISTYSALTHVSGTLSVWNVSASPWPGYPMNDSARSVMSNLAVLKEGKDTPPLTEDASRNRVRRPTPPQLNEDNQSTNGSSRLDGTSSGDKASTVIAQQSSILTRTMGNDDMRIEDARRREERIAKQTTVQSSTYSRQMASSMNKMLDVMNKSLTVQSSMDSSLKELNAFLKKQAAESQLAQDTAETERTKRENTNRGARKSKEFTPTPPPVVSMKRS